MTANSPSSGAESASSANDSDTQARRPSNGELSAGFQSDPTVDEGAVDGLLTAEEFPAEFHENRHDRTLYAKYLQRFNAARDQRGESAQGGLFGGEPPILGVQLATAQVLVEFGWKFLGGYESVQCILINRQVRLKPCAQFAIARAPCLRVGIDSATCRFVDRAGRVWGHRDTITYPATPNTTGSIASIPYAALSIFRSFPRVLTGAVSGLASAVVRMRT